MTTPVELVIKKSCYRYRNRPVSYFHYEQGSRLMTFTLNDVKGLGPSSVKDLGAQGIRTVNDLAHASIADVSATPGFGDVRAARVIKAAADLLGSEAAMSTKTTSDKPAGEIQANKQSGPAASTGGTASQPEKEKPKDKKKDKKKKPGKEKKKKKGKKSKKSKK